MKGRVRFADNAGVFSADVVKIWSNRNIRTTSRGYPSIAANGSLANSIVPCYPRRAPGTAIRSKTSKPETRPRASSQHHSRSPSALSPGPTPGAPLGPLTIANTHLSFVPGWNRWQLRRLTCDLRGIPGPHILMGDLNMAPATAARARS